jgi:hypothetical protein
MDEPPTLGLDRGSVFGWVVWPVQEAHPPRLRSERGVNATIEGKVVLTYGSASSGLRCEGWLRLREGVSLGSVGNEGVPSSSLEI